MRSDGIHVVLKVEQWRRDLFRALIFPQYSNKARFQMPMLKNIHELPDYNLKCFEYKYQKTTTL